MGPLAVAWLALSVWAADANSLPDGGTADGPATGGADAERDGAREPASDAAPATPAAPPSSPPTRAPASPPAPASAAPPEPLAPLCPLRATVFEKGTRHRLAGASITIDAAPAGETDEQGFFATELPAGRHTVAVQLPGFELLQQGVELSSDRHAPAVVSFTWLLLRRWTDRRYQTVVTAPPQESRITLAGEEASATPGAAGDPFRTIESLPGVAQIQWPLAFYAVRGANPGNTGFFVDGIRVPAIFHFALGPSVIHPYLIERLDFYPGGYPPPLGGYVSGVVAAKLATPPTDLAHASVDVRVYDVGGVVTSPWDSGRGTIAIAGRYSYTGALASLFFSDVKLRYGDYQVRADHPFAGGRLTLMAMGSFDSLAVKLGQTGDGALEFHRLDLRWERGLGGGRLRVSITLSLDWARSNLFDSPITVSAHALVPRLEYDRRLGVLADLAVGASVEDARFQPTTPPMFTDGTFDDLARPRRATTAAVQAALVIARGSRLELTPGLRLAEYLEQDVTRLGTEPRLNANLRLGAGFSLKAAMGRFTQMPSLPVGVPGFESFDLRDLGLQHSLQASLGGASELADAWQVDLTGFYQQLRLSDVRSTLTRDLRQQSFLEMRDGRSYGVELLIRRRATHRLHGWLAYTLSRSERVVDGVFGPSDWDQRHIFNLLGTYRLPRGYSVGGRFHYHSGRPYPVQTSGNFGDVEYQRLPAFYQLDLRADKRVVFDRFVLVAYVELGNATLTNEVTGLSPLNANTQRLSNGSQREIGYRIVLPSLGVHAEF